MQITNTANIFAANSIWVYLHSHFWCGFQKTHLFYYRVRIGHSRSSKVDDFGTNWKRICDFLLVRHSNLGVSCSCNVDLLAENCKFYYPSLIRRPSSLRFLWNFAVKLTTKKLVMALSSSEDGMIVAWVVLTQYQHLTAGQTESIIASTAFCWVLTRCTRKLSYRKDDRAMCLYTSYMYGCRKNFRQSLTTPTATFLEIFNGHFSHRCCECAYKIWSS